MATIITGEKQFHDPDCLVKVSIADRRTPANPDAGGWMWDVLFATYPNLPERERGRHVHVALTNTAQDCVFVEQATIHTRARSGGPVQHHIDPNGFWLERMTYEAAVECRIVAGMTVVDLGTGKIIDIVPKDGGK